MKGIYITAIATFLASGVLAQDIELLPCGDAQYNPTQYVCYDEKFLCPILNGDVTVRCGDACYSEMQYTCNDGRLEQLVEAEGPVTVAAANPAAPIHEMTFEACGREFLLGPDGPCTYCPSFVPEGECPAGDKTILFSGERMSVLVPTGQKYYIEPNGSLGFTQARSDSVPPGSVFGVTAYENGAFTYGGAAWMACPREGAESPEWKIFAQLPGLVFAGNCISFDAVVNVQESDERGAWQYV